MTQLWKWLVARVRDALTLPAQLRETERRLDLQRNINANLVKDINGRAKYEDDLRLRIDDLERSESIPGLTSAEIERLAVLAGECGRVAQGVSKVLRHGWHGVSSSGVPTNRVILERGMGEMRATIELMLDAGDVRRGDVVHWQRGKRASAVKP